MNKAQSILLVCLAALTVAACGRPGAGGTGDSDGVVATINGQAISQDEFLRYMLLKPTVQVNTPQGVGTARVAESISFQIFDDLMRQKLLAQMAKDEGVYPTEKEVEQELLFREKRTPNYLQLLTKRGMTPGMVKDQLKLDMAQFRLLTKGVTVTKEDVDKYIKENPGQFKTPALADLVWIMVTSPEKQKQVDDEFKRGQSAEGIAARYSEAPNGRETQGRFPIRVVDQMPPELKGVVQKTAEQNTTAWIKVRGGWAKFYVAKKTPPKAVPIDETLREVVRRDVAMARGKGANDLDKRLHDKMKNGDIKIVMAGLEEPWKRAKAAMVAAGPKPPPSLEKAVTPPANTSR